MLYVVDKKCPAGRCKSLMQYVIDPELELDVQLVLVTVQLMQSAVR
jgi:hypothetical protein